MFRFVLAAVAAFFVTSAANAADVQVYKYSDGTGHFIGVDGQIEEGDLEKIRQAYYDPRISVEKFNIHLRSPGGLGSEMKAIVDWMKGHHINTVADGKCFSACAVIWAHGTSKYVKEGTEVGFHVSSMAMVPEAITFLNQYKDSYGWAGIQQGFQDQYAESLRYYYEMPVAHPDAFVAEIGMASGGNNFWYMTRDNSWIIGHVTYYS